MNFLIPSGTISFISRCWGGRVSDKYITQQSDLLLYMEPGDLVLADRGFNIAEDIVLYGAKLEIPAFTNRKKQLSRKVEYSQRLTKLENSCRTGYQSYKEVFNSTEYYQYHLSSTPEMKGMPTLIEF